MVIEASQYLFEATKQRFFFKNVSILIPWTWKENPQYKDPKYESFTRVRVKSFLKNIFFTFATITLNLSNYVGHVYC